MPCAVLVMSPSGSHFSSPNVFQEFDPLTWCTEIDFWVTCTEEDRDRETEAQVLKWEARDLSKLIISVGNAAIHKANAEIIVMTQR